MADAPVSAPEGSAAYDADNLLDRHSRRCTLELNYRHMMERERALVDRELGLRGGDVLSVGCGWHPGRHLFPAPAFRLVGADADPAKVAGVLSVGCGWHPGRHLFPAPAFRLVGADADPAKVAGVLESGRADDGVVGYAGRLGLAPRSFDLVLYRLVLHHLVFQGPLRPCFEEAAQVLRPGGALIAVEPGLWHPVGAALALANRTSVAARVHGTPDDIPLSPLRLVAEARAVGLEPRLHAVTYTWRRLAPPLQRALWPLDELGSRVRAARFGHTLMLIARAPG